MDERKAHVSDTPTFIAESREIRLLHYTVDVENGNEKRTGIVNCHTCVYVAVYCYAVHLYSQVAPFYFLLSYGVSHGDFHRVNFNVFNVQCCV